MNVSPNPAPTVQDRPPGEGGVPRVAGPGGSEGVLIGNPELLDKGVFAHRESEVAAVSGIHVKQLQKIRTRQLLQGDHWGMADGHVAYTRAGLAALLEKAT